VERRSGQYILTTELHNKSASPALMVRLSAVRDVAGDRILPVLFSDNFVALMPGEHRSVEAKISSADARGEAPSILVEGFNVAATRSRTVQ
jgi:hypothetical protein